jgi:hypothetical protein
MTDQREVSGRRPGRQHHSDAGTAVWAPAVDISERKDAYLVTRPSHTEGQNHDEYYRTHGAHASR